MSKPKFSEIKVGIFVLGAVILILATSFWAKGFIASKDLREMKAYFTNVSGLNVGDPVTVMGVKMGRVEEIKLVGDSIEIDFTLDKSVKVKQDYKIEVAILELMGGKCIFINPGKSNVEIDYAYHMNGSEGADLGAMFRKVDALGDSVSILLGKFSSNSDNINRVLLNVNDLIGDPQLKSNMKGTLANFESTSRNLNLLVAENRVSLGNLSSKVGQTVDNVNTILDDSSPEFKKTFDNIQILTGRVDSLINNLNTMVLDIQDEKGSVGKFIYDEKFYENMNKTLIEIEKLTKKIRTDGVKINLF
ncbi:MAG TPA: MlaD family protein [Ignavibacteria bacterium]|nr:MlaD family protein [Ignavibacteria bacterium]